MKDLLSENELAAVTRKSDFRAAGIVIFDWAAIVLIFTVTAMYPNPVTILLAIILLGGRQRRCALQRRRWIAVR